MKRFISFAEETTPEKVEDLSQYSHNMTVPEHGAHSKAKKEDELHGPVHSSEDEEDTSEYSHDMTTPEHGSHSKLKEDASNEDKDIEEWFHHNDNEHLGNDANEIGEHLHRYHDYDRTPNRDAIRSYTGHSRDLNQYLVARYNQEGKLTKDHPDYEPVDHVHEKKAEKLDAALHHHKNPFYLDTYHGATFHPGKLAAEHPNNRIYFPSFVSTSTRKRKAASFGSNFNSAGNKGYSDEHRNKHILHFHLEPGHKGMYLGKHSEFPEEKEFLLPRGFSAHIHPTPDVYENEEGGKTHVWHVRDIQQSKPKPRKLTPEEKAIEKLRKTDPIAADIHEANPVEGMFNVLGKAHKMQPHHWKALMDKVTDESNSHKDANMEAILDSAYAPKEFATHVLDNPHKYKWAASLAATHKDLTKDDFNKYMKSAPDHLKIKLLKNKNSTLDHFNKFMNDAPNEKYRELAIESARQRFGTFSPEYKKFREDIMSHPEHGKMNSRILANVENYDKYDYPNEWKNAGYKYVH